MGPGRCEAAPRGLGEGGHMGSSKEQAIFDEIVAFGQAWNRGDARAAASFFSEDAVRVDASGNVQQGRAEIEAAYYRLFHETMPGAVAKIDRGTIRTLSPVLAVWQAGLEISMPGSGPPLRGHVVQVMEKVGGRWRIVESHPKFFWSPFRPAT
ncbi:hypothetical protein HRbin32_00632 [bacterium HR32]|nr:hypothetical protein HRbin32_00632 [bacterium HR32]